MLDPRISENIDFRFVSCIYAYLGQTASVVTREIILKRTASLLIRVSREGGLPKSRVHFVSREG